MGVLLNLVERNLHEVQVDADRMLFHIPSSSLFTADAVTGGIIDTLRQQGCSAEELMQRLGQQFAGDDIQDTLRELIALELVSDGSPLTPEIALRQVERTALNTVVLNVNTGCNLSCTYCYKEDLDKPSAGKKMSTATAEASVEMLLKESPNEQRYSVVFFGGEPLSNRPLIEHMVAYCERRFAEAGKQVEFIMTTNATLLTEEIIDWLNAHRFGLSISIDGPKTVHDRNRITVGGQGTYDVVRRKADLLLSRYTSRPVGARVTLTRGITDVETIWNHLFNEIGFAEVGFAPVTSGDMADFNLTGDELVQVFANMKALGRRYLEAALEHRNIGFSNLHQLITDIHEGHKKALPCGAGLKMLAVDHEGELNLCHRFTGSSLPTFGNVHQGVKQVQLNDFLSQRLDRSNTGCESCRIRNLCSGGCYHESYARYGDPQHPTYHYCELMRDWVDFGIEVYSRIMAANPAFIDRYITPRKAH
ncbi:quinohemoprotein amine dehydrogenase maturation protein [Pseudomonas putida]|uniref:quinohemoprotein amine dehydrogenase maturation protein n=1 Tax=Pseudomonas putida TaxID=303 RepID=UPI00226D4FBA|nr:quinohemoprotein amine dehydrogenase maturation protein [Pseudomonas putida]MDD2145655.1 quinohemoprotein amine dehydrogenase maturation protein [Pseudomonas putida]HDS1705228.1 quinohemoprotein amine dehydrogenase maturation protein [Pseudomonas putida]